MSENKTGKYLKYAVGEILLVMIGILLALQVNNWNQNRQELVKEKYYLKSIKYSIQLSQEEFNRVIEDAEHISSSADTLFVLLAQKETEQLKGVFLDSLLDSAGGYSLISLNDGGVQEILNTGSLEIIRDDQIRIHLASWNERMHKIRKFEEETEYLSKQYQEYKMQYVDRRRFISKAMAMEGVVIPDKRQQLFRDPTLTNYLDKIAGINKLMYDIYTEEKKVMDSLVLLINNYLNK